jgi:hypothetical protein
MVVPHFATKESFSCLHEWAQGRRIKGGEEFWAVVNEGSFFIGTTMMNSCRSSLGKV